MEPMTKQDLEALYATSNISDIAKQLSVSRVTVYSWFKKYGIERKETKVEVVCHFCRGKKLILKSVVSLSEKHFCCKSCYMDYLRSDEHRAERDRKRVSKMEYEEYKKKARI